TDLAEVLLGDEAPEVAERGGEAKGEGHHVDSRAPSRRLGEPARLRVADGEGLLAQDVLAGLDGGRGHGVVQVTRRADDDGVDPGVVEERLPRGVDARDRPAARVRPGSSGVAGGDGDDLAELGQEAEARQVDEIGDAPGAHDADPEAGVAQPRASSGAVRRAYAN